MGLRTRLNIMLGDIQRRSWHSSHPDFGVAALATYEDIIATAPRDTLWLDAIDKWASLVCEMATTRLEFLRLTSEHFSEEVVPNLKSLKDLARQEAEKALPRLQDARATCATALTVAQQIGADAARIGGLWIRTGDILAALAVYPDGGATHGEAIRAYRQALTYFDVQRDAHDRFRVWRSILERNLAGVCAAPHKSVAFSEILDGYREPLKEFTETRSSLHHAQLQHAYADALGTAVSFGVVVDVAKCNEARADAYRIALRCYPRDWIDQRHNCWFGLCLSISRPIDPDSAQLAALIEACQGGLAELGPAVPTRRFLHLWMAEACYAMASITDKVENLRRAVETCRAGLAEPGDAKELDLQIALAEYLTALGEVSKAIDVLREAIDVCNQVEKDPNALSYSVGGRFAAEYVREIRAKAEDFIDRSNDKPINEES